MSLCSTIDRAKPKFDREIALKAASEVCKHLKLATERLIVAGSLRRRAKRVGDVEILFIPQFVDAPVEQGSLFDANTTRENATEKAIQWMLDAYILEKRPNVNGSFTWGRENKYAIHCATKVPIDLFSTTADKWWVSLVIRTGSKQTNLRLTTGANKQGATLHAYGVGVEYSDGRTEPATSERHVFEMCNVPYLEPWQR